MNQYDHTNQSCILITGATGFIGKHFVRAIVPYTRIKILARITSNIQPLQQYHEIEIVYGDLDTGHGLDKALVNVDSVVHCAARTIGNTYNEYYRTNTLGTHHLVNAMLRTGVKNILHVSTNAASGPSATQKPLGEDDKAHPVSHYGRTKKLAEDIVKQSTLNYTILRPVAVYGPYDLDMLKYIKLIAQGMCPVVGSGEKFLNMIFVRDLVRIMMFCITQQVYENRTFFVHDGHCYRFMDVVNTVAQLLNKKVRVIHVPKFLAMVYGLYNELFVPRSKQLIRRDKIHELACKYWLCSNERSVKELGFKPQYSLIQGMKETVQWYQENNYLS